MANRLYKFANYDFEGKSIIQEAPRPMSGRTLTAETPGTHGGMFTAARGRLDPRRLRLVGTLLMAKAGVGETLESMLGDLLAAVAPGAPRKLYWGRDDRYFLVHPEPVDLQESPYLDGLPWSVEFVCYDNRPSPTEYADALTTTSSLTTGGGNVTNGGTADALPESLTLNVSSIGAGGSVTVTNTTTGQAFTLTPAATGTTTISSYDESVLRGGVDKSAEFAGEFLRLAPGVNTLTVATASGLTLAAAPVVTHRNRWY